MFKEFEQTLYECEQLSEKSLRLVTFAIEKAGSVSRLARSTGIRRQSIALWARAAVIPTPKNARVILNWLKANSEFSK